MGRYEDYKGGMWPMDPSLEDHLRYSADDSRYFFVEIPTRFFCCRFTQRIETFCTGILHTHAQSALQTLYNTYCNFRKLLPLPLLLSTKGTC